MLTRRHPFRAATLCIALASASGVAAPGGDARPRQAPATRVSFDYDARRPLSIKSGPVETLDGYTRQAFTFASPVQGRVPAMKFLPRPAPKTPKPAVIFLHGLPGDFQAMAPLAAAYARAGWAGLALSAPFARSDLPYRRNLNRLLPAPLFNEHDLPETIQAVVDIRRAIDVLAADAGVAAHQIVVVGFSYGGALASLAFAADSRVAAVGLMSPTSGLAAWTRLAQDSHVAKRFFLELPANHRDVWLRSMDTVDSAQWLARTSRAAPILIQAGLSDQSVSPDDVALLIRAAGSRATVKWYEAGHALPPATQLDQVAFFEHHLGARLNGFIPTASSIR